MRDALFNVLAARIELTGARVLDLFAGSGALGFEALRRGAGFVIFVEHDHGLAGLIRTQGRDERWSNRIEVWRKDAVSAVHELGRRGRTFDVIVLDPPYGRGWIPRILRAVVTDAILAAEGVVVAEGHWRDRPEAVDLALIREARYGETALWFFTQGDEEV